MPDIGPAVQGGAARRRGLATNEAQRDSSLRRPCSRSSQDHRDWQRPGALMDNRLLIEKISGPFLFHLKGTPAEYKAGLDRAIEKGWLVLHESGTYVKFTQAGAE